MDRLVLCVGGDSRVRCCGPTRRGGSILRRSRTAPLPVLLGSRRALSHYPDEFATVSTAVPEADISPAEGCSCGTSLVSTPSTDFGHPSTVEVETEHERSKSLLGGTFLAPVDRCREARILAEQNRLEVLAMLQRRGRSAERSPLRSPSDGLFY